MEIDLANLPEDAEALKVLVHQLVGTVQSQGLKIAQLEARLVKLKRMQFGQSSEKLSREIEQLELNLILEARRQMKGAGLRSPGGTPGTEGLAS